MGKRGIHPLLSERALDEAEEAEDAAAAVVSALRDAEEDHVVTDAEWTHISRLARRSVEESRDVVIAAELATVADAVVDNLRRGGVTLRVARRARAVGIVIPQELELVAGTQTS